jgi:hypothetical protein
VVSMELNLRNGVELGCTTVGAASKIRGDGGVQRALDDAPSIALSPRSIGWSLRWRMIVDRRSYEG